MKPEDFKKTTTDILTNITDQGKVTEYLTQLNDVYTSSHTTNESLKEQQQKYEKEIAALKETNMNLFLKIQSPNNQTDDLAGATNNDPQLSYDTLVKDLGGIK